MTKTILIADGDSDVREQLKWCLRNAGYHVVTAQDRFETMTALMSQRIDLLLLDAAMAGPESNAVLQQVSPGGQFDRTPILILAESSDQVPAELAAVVKPIQPRQLVEIVSGVVGAPGRGRPQWAAAGSDKDV
ncbi:MAG TPA: response regulator [Polyangia bacterium]|jgi:two-component system alkaline phosphatase synthesis response regulator PhoP|nr:response regulator [Polyangia bacterium]